MITICPVCGNSLEKIDGSLKCTQNHNFDIAKSGYVNLLMSKSTGDSKEMIQARTSFLNRGYYEPFSILISKLTSGSYEIVDAGCGEGYYTKNIAIANNCDIYGFDLSKVAIEHAAKSTKSIKNILFGVASIFELPILSDSTDAVVNLFAPCAAEEFWRILKPKGKLIMGVAGVNHLYSFKKTIYEEAYKNELRRDLLENFDLVDIQSLSYEIELNSNEDIKNLFMMTPYYWKTSIEDKNKLLQQNSLKTELAFDVLVYEKSEV